MRNWSTERRKLWMIILLFLTLGFLTLGTISARAQKQSPIAAPALSPAGSVEQSHINREIFDPGSGIRWILVPNVNHPGGPGRLVMISANESLAAGKIPNLSSGINGPVIRAGETVILEEHTGRVDVRLEAVALGSARDGATLRVRMKVGGRITPAIANGPGHASLAPNPEVWP